MATTYKVLGQAAPANTSNTDLITVGTGKSQIISTLFVTNVTASDATCSVYVRVAGAAAADSNALLKTVTVAAKSVLSITAGICLGAADVLTVQSSAANALTFQAHGQENS